MDAPCANRVLMHHVHFKGRLFNCLFLHGNLVCFKIPCEAKNAALQRSLSQRPIVCPCEFQVVLRSGKWMEMVVLMSLFDDQAAIQEAVD